LRSGRSGALASSNANGQPLATLALVATDSDGTPVILVSALSGHTKNLRVNARASLLIAQSGKGDPLAHPRISASVQAQFVNRESHDGLRIRRRFLAKHPKAALRMC
jgi:putative heme iron utilization protein